MRYWWIGVLFIACACGQKRPAPGSWPARVANKEGFSTEQWQAIESAIEYLNEGTGKNAVQINSSKGYPIFFKLVKNAQSTDKRAGLATVEADQCTIEISDVIFESVHKEVIIPVVDHEIGHCAGLGHDSSLGEVMYKTTEDLKDYTPSALRRFFDSVASSAGL